MYVLKNVTVRQFRDVKLLSTTKTTEITLSDNQDKLQEVTSETYEEQALLTNTSSNGNIISITIAKNYTCPSCHKNIAVNSDSQFVRCSSCNMKVLKGSLTSSMHATMSFKPTDADAPPLKLMCFDKCLKDFITAVQKPNFQTDVDELENFLLLNQFNLSYDESFVVSKISQVKQ
ncbi:hypothetical protein FSP39_000843 [Pinctada imbricata]|uniref:Uncharacterized protein n=1 Tax=Pinctada imbricata TaxID=66713 RepID=A0AA89CAG4_PINIB|nr:hypothetical protein FSP39_000843 [Pinctada imbricata]